MRKITYRDAVREALREEMQRDENVIIIGNQVAHPDGGWGINRGLIDLFGAERVIDMGIAEGAITGMAIGAAFLGARPVADYGMSDFLAVAYDPIAVHMAKWNYVAQGKLNGMPCVCRCGIANSGPHHSARVYSIFANQPGMKIVVPSTAADAKGLLKSSIRDNDPVLVCEMLDHLADLGEVPEEEYTVPIGKANVEVEGSDVTIVTIGTGAILCRKAMREIQAAGISAELIDLRSVRPLDMETVINSVKKTKNLIIVEEAPKTYSCITGEVAFGVQNALLGQLERPIERLTMGDYTVPTGPIEKYVLMQPEQIVEAVKNMLGK